MNRLLGEPPVLGEPSRSAKERLAIELLQAQGMSPLRQTVRDSAVQCALPFASFAAVPTPVEMEETPRLPLSGAEENSETVAMASECERGLRPIPAAWKPW